MLVWSKTVCNMQGRAANRVRLGCHAAPQLHLGDATCGIERKLYNVNISGLTLVQDWLNEKPT